MKKLYYDPTTKILFRLAIAGIVSVSVGFIAMLLLSFERLSQSPYINAINLVINISIWLFLIFFLAVGVLYQYLWTKHKDARMRLLEFIILGQIYRPGDEREELVKYKAGYHAFLNTLGLLPILFIVACLSIISVFKSNHPNAISLSMTIIGLSILAIYAISFITFRYLLKKQGIEWEKKIKDKK